MCIIQRTHAKQCHCMSEAMCLSWNVKRRQDYFYAPSNAHKQTGRWQPSNKKLPHCDWYNDLSSTRDNKAFASAYVEGGGMKSFESGKFYS